MTKPNTGFYSAQVGALGVTTIHDGGLTAPIDILTGIDHATAEATLKRNFRGVPLALTVNAFLVRHAGGLALVDTGSDTKMGPDSGRLVGNLAAFGVAPADIGTILVTHLHRDHIGGMTGADNRALFPNAEVVVGATEHRFWTDAAQPLADRLLPTQALVAMTLAAYAGRVRTVAPGQEGLPGMRLLELPGHTPGHAGWLLESGGESLLIWGDIVHLPGLQFTRPEATTVFDVDPALATASRRRAFDMASTDRLMVAGMHLDFPGLGHVERRGEGYGFVPVPWHA